MYGDRIDDMVREGQGFVAGLMRVGALDAVGAENAMAALNAGDTESAAAIVARSIRTPLGRTGLPSPAFMRSARETARRAPLGFTEQGTGNMFFTLAAAIGAVSRMFAKVSRVSHVDRLLIVPDAPGAIVTSIKIGDEEQVLSAGAPVELYSEFALTDVRPDNFSPLQSGLDFIVTLENTTAGLISGTIGCKAEVER